MPRNDILPILYEMALVIGGEISLQPLLTRTLQRLLYHTSFPAGFICLDLPPPGGDVNETQPVKIDTVIGDYELAGLKEKTLSLPVTLLHGEVLSVAEDPLLLSSIPVVGGRYHAYLRLPIKGCGVIILLAQKMPENDLPLTQMFQPVMANLAKAIKLCRQYDAHNAELIAKREQETSERKKAETELRELNNDFVTLLENTGDFIYFKDQDRRIRFCSQTLARISSHTSWRDLIGKCDQEIFPEETAQLYFDEESAIFQQGKPLLNKTEPYYDEHGELRWMNTNKWPVFANKQKTVVGIFGISRDVTELKEAQEKVIELNRDLEQRVVERTEQLEAANKELEAFSYSVSHDLRSPLRAIDGFSQMLLEDHTDKLDDEGKRLLNVVRSNTQRMAKLIDDILAFSRTSRLEMTFAEIGMEKLAHEVIEELHPITDTVQVEIEAIPPATGDRAMMRQVFINLLSNAIKFSRHKAPALIKVGGYAAGDEAIYFVRDNGAGFDMKYADKLFGVFQRLHAINEFEGTGIGLAIVKRIITRHGGRVWAEGKVNEGATIYFALPIK